jgi:transposase
MLSMIDEAVAAGARLERACAIVGIAAKSIQRWRAANGGEDRRRGPVTLPPHRLSDEERRRVLSVLVRRGDVALRAVPTSRRERLVRVLGLDAELGARAQRAARGVTPDVLAGAVGRQRRRSALGLRDEALP